ncbi:cytochrome P450 4V2 [Nephila pilipes]|uniref:Cytochrome P450 4V2 n=1 Tax=Nephila pilipes TaxID=299642 RepID=A0A8X6PW15_NEPPI|nr:cytochrome P450 4V2 [Nephila pilipes]
MLAFEIADTLSIQRNFLIIWKTFVFLLVCVGVGSCLILMRYTFWRRKISQQIPGEKVRFFSISGSVSALMNIRTKNSRLNFVYALQLFSEYAKKWATKKLFCVWLFYHPLIIIVKASAVQEVLGSNKMIERCGFVKWFEPIFGTGIIISSGDKWKSRRKMLNMCFRYEFLKEQLPVLNEKSQILVKYLKEETCKDFTKIFKPISFCALDIICDSILGIHIGAQESKKEPEFIHAANWGFRLNMERSLNIFHWPDFIYYRSRKGKEMKKHIQTWKEFIQCLVQKEKQKYLKRDLKVDESHRKSLVNLLLEHHFQTNDLSDEDIGDELLSFFIAGHDTTSAAVSWTLYLLGLYPDIQNKVHEELDSIFGGDVQRPATEYDLKEMKYLKCIIKETLRMYPPVSLVERCVTRDTTLCGYQIPKGATCLIIPFILHRDEDMFPNPEIFDPDRFLPENSLTRHPFAYIPFSAGPRNCLGKNNLND